MGDDAGGVRMDGGDGVRRLSGRALCCVLMTRNSSAGSDFMFLIYLSPFFCNSAHNWANASGCAGPFCILRFWYFTPGFHCDAAVTQLAQVVLL